MLKEMPHEIFFNRKRWLKGIKIYKKDIYKNFIQKIKLFEQDGFIFFDVQRLHSSFEKAESSAGRGLSLPEKKGSAICRKEKLP